MLKLTIIGNIGKDAETKTFNGATYATFSVAHTEKSVDNATTTWVSCTKRIGEDSRLTDYLKKGTKVYAEGNFSIKEYTSDGVKKTSINLWVSSLELLSKAENQVARQEFLTKQQPEKAEIHEDDDLPF